MSPRRFEGWEPATETRHTYDRRGRLIRSVTTREPEWNDQDRTEILALAEYRAGSCGGCGHQRADTTSHHETGPEFEVRHATCRACAALAEERRAKADGGGGANDGRFFWVERR